MDAEEGARCRITMANQIERTMVYDLDLNKLLALKGSKL